MYLCSGDVRNLRLATGLSLRRSVWIDTGLEDTENVDTRKRILITNTGVDIMKIEDQNEPRQMEGRVFHRFM
jgi:hypothetical protein